MTLSKLSSGGLAPAQVRPVGSEGVHFPDSLCRDLGWPSNGSGNWSAKTRRLIGRGPGVWLLGVLPGKHK